MKSSHSNRVSSFSSHVRLSQSSSISNVSRLATKELSEQCLRRDKRTEERKEQERQGRRRRTSITATRFSKGHKQRGGCAYKEDKQMEGRVYGKQEQSLNFILKIFEGLVISK